MGMPAVAAAQTNDAAQAKEPASLGLKGLWAQVANLSAVALIALAFFQAQQSILRTGADDRQMFREELRAQRETLDRSTRAVEQLADQIRRGAPRP